MVRHEAVGDDPDAGEGLLVAEDFAEDLLVAGLEDPAPVDDAGNDMIKERPDPRSREVRMKKP